MAFIIQVQKPLEIHLLHKIVFHTRKGNHYYNNEIGMNISMQ